MYVVCQVGMRVWWAQEKKFSLKFKYHEIGSLPILSSPYHWIFHLKLMEVTEKYPKSLIVKLISVAVFGHVAKLDSAQAFSCVYSIFSIL